MARSGVAVGLLVAALAGGALAACGTPAELAPRLPADADQVVAELGFAGSMATESELFETPALAVYPDGTAVAGADRTLRLTQAEVVDLVSGLRLDLDRLPPTVDVGADRRIADAGASVLRVRHDDGTLQSVEAYALGVVPGYPATLVAARNRLVRLADRVRQHGTPYAATRVRLIAIDRRGPTGPVRNWPAGVPVPPPVPDFVPGARRADLAGPGAAAARSAWPDRADHSRSWRLPDGSPVVVGWRYLLPHEPAR